MNFISKHSKLLGRCFLVLLIVAMMGAFACSAAAEDVAAEAEEYTSLFNGTFWALLPPVIAIVLALITKEVYSSLFLGILSGGILYAIDASGFHFETMFNAVVHEGFIINLADEWNVGILIFLVVLGAIVVMMNRAGGSRAYGEWASAKIKNRRGAQLATFGLGALIFVDDYFNCLTVGSVMRPITDKQSISRAKLAYLIDATAAPICIIAPISSWAAAVSGTVEGVNGIALFIQTIPYNLYALLTISMVLFIAFTGMDYGPMKRYEQNALNGDLHTSGGEQFTGEEDEKSNPRGKVMDLIIPVVILIILCVAGMIYTGGFFSGTSFIDAFAGCDAAYGLAMGSIAALIINMIYFMARRVLSFKECTASIPEGFKQMVPAILILTFAWGLKSMTGLLDASGYVAAMVEGAKALQILLPAILFLVACGLSFATGTSWGTFGILIPIVTGVFEKQLAGVTDSAAIPSMVVICIAACLAGAVCGDHCSPISDTTIMASAGAKSDHVNHVSTQLPYALTVAAVTLVGYLLAGFVQNVFVVLGVSLVLMIAVLLLIRMLQKKKA
ncbi:MAG: Na+/H+ antiporter NhaC family protein [Clostridia bacterium]|nr:Na+/H+ antiporter NhaC family protein [Clostridia bacterium]